MEIEGGSGSTICFQVSEEEAGQRLDQVLSTRGLPHTRSQVKRHLDAGAASVNGEVARPSRRLRAGDEVAYCPLPPEPELALPETIPLCILFEDEQVIVLDKPPGMVVHPAAGHSGGTLVNALLGHGAELSLGSGGPSRSGIVHRLDRFTSGVMVTCKTEQAHALLAEQFARHTVERRYLALVSGIITQNDGTFDTLHGRHPVDRKRFSSRVARGRRAVTHYRVVQRLHGATLVEARLETGRTHQVRVHFADGGFPVLGDPLYGRLPKQEPERQVARELGRQALHARLLAFTHPTTGERLSFSTAPPPDMQRALAALGGTPWPREV